MFEIEDQGGDGFGHAPGQRAVIAFDILMAIPIAAGKAIVIAAPDLHKAHTTFQESAGGKAFAAHVVGFFSCVDLSGPFFAMFLDAIHGFDCGGFLADIERLGCGELHFGGKFVAFDSGIQAAVFFALLLVDLVELFQQGKAGAVAGGLDITAGFVGEKIADGCFGPRIDDGACMLRGQESAVPVLWAIGCKTTVIRQDDKGGQIVAERAEAIAYPAAHTGKTG